MDSQPSNRTADDAQAPVSVRVVEAVAEREGIDPLELSPPLHDAIDPTALDDLFESNRSRQRDAGSVSFTYCGYSVRVESDGRVDLETETERDSGVRSETNSR
ncbi:HalOD1 output domain-containing protein [Natrinema versiforme]|uniref:Halobacterial output domain-containing protein n=1 Tax=Natrinema versiforme TaxID=88724 RepID=A0A4V1FYQ2_9EURY|nr:HalOD1 output domain-containing protein [Natrinema versiforme]QCS41403.1 hypothetical protein FEJ81_03190 [Natrinema versiforme]